MISFRELTDDHTTGSAKPGRSRPVHSGGATSMGFRFLTDPIDKTEAPTGDLHNEKPKVAAAKTGDKNRESLYEEAHVYLNQVLIAVRNQKRFDLEWGIQIMREIVDFLSPNDEILIHAIHSEGLYNYVVGHSVNVAIFSTLMGKSLGYSRDQMIEVGIVGLLHDLGMGLIPEDIIYKKDRLSSREYEIMKQRPLYGYKILQKFGDEHPYLAECALQVYERIDGSGYPKALKGDEIHEYAQIVGLAAVYEALIHSRPQREKFLHFVAAKEIIKTGKKCFQTEHLKALLKIFSIFPMNTIVRLNSGSIGRVLETYPDQPMRPKIQILYDSQKREVLAKRIIDLPDNPLLYIIDAVSEDELSELTGTFDPRGQERQADRFGGHGSGSPIAQNRPVDAHAGTPEGTSRKKKVVRRARPGLARILLFAAAVVGLIGMGMWRWHSGQRTQEKSEDNAIKRYGIREQAGKAETPVRGNRIPVAEIAKPASDAGETASDTGREIRDLPEKATEPVQETGAAVSEAVEPTAAIEVRDRVHGIDRNNLVIGQNNDGQGTRLDERTKRDPVPGTIPDMTVSDYAADLYRIVPGAAAPSGTMSGELTSEDTAPAYPFSVKVSYYKTREEAQASLSDLVDRGLSPYWVKVDLGDQGIWYRIFAGHFERVEDAQAYIAEKGLQGAAAKNTRFSAVVGKHESRETAEIQMHEIQARGYSPYLIQRGDGIFLVYVGAFYTRKGAEEQAADLKRDGIWNRVVER